MTRAHSDAPIRGGDGDSPRSVVPGLVSIILVNRNGGPWIDSICPAIERQTYSDHEVIVVDNDSTDDSVSRIRARLPRVSVIELHRNTGFSAALNSGIRAARGEFILSLNFDVTLEPTFIGVLAATLRQYTDVGWAAGALRRLTPAGPVDEIDCNGHYFLPSRYVYGCDPARHRPADYPNEADVFGASACAAMYRRSMLEALAIHGQVFDEDLFAYFEDVDLDWRAQQAGYRCLFVPSAIGAHARGGGGHADRPEGAALILSNRFLVMLKNDEVRDIWKDLSPIVRRTLADVRSSVRRKQTKALWLAAGRVVRLAPRMWSKRRLIRRMRRGDHSPVSRFRMQTTFLG